MRIVRITRPPQLPVGQFNEVNWLRGNRKCLHRLAHSVLQAERNLATSRSRNLDWCLLKILRRADHENLVKQESGKGISNRDYGRSETVINVSARTSNRIYKCSGNRIEQRTGYRHIVVERQSAGLQQTSIRNDVLVDERTRARDVRDLVNQLPVVGQYPPAPVDSDVRDLGVSRIDTRDIDRLAQH